MSGPVPASTDGTLERISRDLEARLSRNLELLRQLMPTAHGRFQAYRPRSLELRLDPHAGPVLQGIRSGVSAYPVAPLEYAERQVQEFLNQPVFRTTGLAKGTVLQIEDLIHPPRSNRVVEMLHARTPEWQTEFAGAVNALFVLGLGLGYHLELLLEAADVHHLCIVEPDPDVFYASLHTVEWTALVERFARPGYSLELILEKTPGDATHQISTWTREIGGHNLVQPFIFQHRGGSELEGTLEGLFRFILPYFKTNGEAFDHRRMGLAHSFHHAVRGASVLTEPSGAPAPTPRPLFVVANGPSLDEAVAFLREHRNKAVLLSCGTALGSLVKAGLVPDIHVDLDGSQPVTEWISHATTPEQREQIHLVASNRVHPGVLSLFPRASLIADPADVGGRWLEGLMERGTTPLQVGDSGATVGNFGIAVGAALGFRDVVLFGLDLGYPSGDQHHSRHSVHYRVVSEEQGTLGVHAHDDPTNVYREGNFGGQVRTSLIFVQAAERIAILADRYPGLRLRNTSSGLKIRGTEPARLAKLIPGLAFDTRGYVERVMTRHRRGRAHLAAADPEAARLEAATSELAREARELLATPVASRDEGMRLLLAARALLRERSEQDEFLEAGPLLAGSVSHFSLYMAFALAARRDENEALALFGSIRDVALELLTDVDDLCRRHGLLVEDHRSRELDRKVAKTA